MSDEKKLIGRFPPPPVAQAPRERSRFAAVVEEMFEEVAPIMKAPLPPDRVPVMREYPDSPARQLFSHAGLVDAVPVPCPKCTCTAYEPVMVLGEFYVLCRACPLPAPMYTLDLGVGKMLKTNPYRCTACGLQSRLTMVISEVNLYCSGVGCKRLALHEKQMSRMPGVVVKESW